MIRKYLNKKVIGQYLYDQLTGNFAGFLIGMSATSLVSQFFETRTLKNFWGLGSKKTVVDKDTFSNLELILSIVIGFIAFEIMTRVVKEKIDFYLPVYKYRVKRWLVKKNWHVAWKNHPLRFNSRRIIFFSGMGSGLKNAFSRFSRR
jgi:hypothetical protein